MKRRQGEKKRTFFSRILLPISILLILLPPCTCTVFYYAAKSYAYHEAEKGLEELQENLLPVMESSFSDDIEKSQQVTTFLKQVGPLAAKVNSGASLMILESRLHVVYPRDEQERIQVIPLVEQFSTYIESAGKMDDHSTIEITAEDGVTYLANIYEVKAQSAQIKYIIAYYPAKQIGSWVGQVSRIVLLISSLFVILIIMVLWLAVRNMTRSLKKICVEAERIGNGDFEDIQTEFTITELEELRISMNRMSDQLEQSDEIQKKFFENVSHELRNPLMSISGYAQGIEQGIFSSPTDAAHTILEESGRLTELVNGLLTLSRMENDGNELELIKLKLSDLIGDCIDRINGLALQNNIQIKIEKYNSFIYICADENLFGKVFDNLLTNAIRYARTTVIISVYEQNGNVYIQVADDGAGIADEDMPHLFERCYKGRGGNFGIGLALARSAVHRMNGEIHAQNRENGGAIFSIQLPLSEF